MLSSSGRLLSALIFGTLAPLVSPASADAITTICTPNWAAGTIAGQAITAVLSGPNPPCSAATVTAKVDFGIGANAGTKFPGDILSGLATNQFSRTSPSSVALGIRASTSESLGLTFSQPVLNPHLIFVFTDLNSSFTFAQPFTLAQALNATASGQTVTTTGSDRQDDGFVVQMLGTYSTVNFTYANSSLIAKSVAFTAGGTAVPGPLPVLGVSLAYGYSRTLRRRIKAGSTLN